MENKTTPRDFFMHLLSFGTLYTVAVSLISLWFRYIDIKFPDPLNYYGIYGYEQLRWPMAVLIVVFPVFLFLSRQINREIVADPTKKELRIYRWLVYMTLFVSAITVIIDFISLIYNFLGGELTARFGFKVLVVLIVALGIFGYYLWQLRSDLGIARGKRKALFWGSILVIAGSIIAGFVIVGSPATARARKLDQQRVQDLINMQFEIQSAYANTGKLPIELQNIYTDPLTKDPYEYHPIGGLEYELCAIFETEDNVGLSAYPYPYQSWAHGTGEACFPRTIDLNQIPKPIPVR